MVGRAVALFYDSGYPLGSLYLWPNQGATGATQVHLTLKSNDLAAIASLDTAIPLPPEYDEALIYNLAARLRVSYQLPPDPAVISLAASSLATIRTANTQIPLARMPAGLPGMGRGWAGGSLLPAAGAPSSPKPFQLDGISLLDGPDGLL
jgi:hypothetical protein